MPDIDSLQIQISADAASAVAGLEKLSASLGRIKSAISGIDTSGFQQLASGINQLSTSIQNFSTRTKTADFTRIATGLNRLSNVNVQGVSDASRAISTLTANLNGIGTIAFDSQGIANISNSIAQLGRKTVTQASENIPKLTAALQDLKNGLSNFSINNANFDSLSQLTSSITKLGGKSATTAASGNIQKLSVALKDMMKTLSTAPTVSKNIIQMTQALAQLASAGGRAGTAATGLTRSFDSLPTATSKAKSGFGGLASAIGKFYATYWLLIRGLNQFGNAIDISSKLTEVQNVVDVSFGSMADKMNEFADSALQLYGMSELAAKQIGSRFQAMGVSMGFAQEDMADMSIRLTQLAGDLASFYNITQNEAATKLQSIFTGESEPLRSLGIDLAQTSVEAWALSQGIDADMRSMTNAEKTMLRYQFVLASTGQATNDFIRTQNSWANQLRLLTGAFEQLGSIVGGVLINAFKPFIQALNSVMGSVIQFAQVVSDALGAIFGWEYQVGGGVANDMAGAASAAEDLESATGGAADNAKKLKSYTLGIDELNILEPDTSDSGGGGGGGGGASGGASAGDGGQWVQTETLWEKYTSSIDTLYELGNYISNVLTRAMNSIKWDDVYQTARNFGSGLANFLNGLINPGIFAALGTTIAGSLNTALHFLDSFGETFDWTNFGMSIATGINHFFSTFDFALLAETINTFANGILDTIIVAISQTNWENIGTQIGVFLEGINFTEIGLKVGKAIWEAINAGVELLKGMFSVAPIETTIIAAFGAITVFPTLASKVSGFVTKVLTVLQPFTSLFTGSGLFAAGGPIAAAGAPFIALAAGAAALVAGLGIVFATNEEVRDSFFAATSSISDSLQPAFEFLTSTVIPDIKEAFTGFIDIITPFGEFLNTAFVSVWQDMINPALEYVGTTVIPMLSETFENLWNNVLVPFGEFLGSVLGPAVDILSQALTILWNNIIVPLADFVGTVLAGAFELFVTILNESIIPKINDTITVFQFLWDNVLSPIASFLVSTFGPVFEQVFEAIGELISDLEKAFSGLIDFITGVFTANWELAWTGIKTFLGSTWDAMKTIVSTTFSAIQVLISNILSGIKSGWETVWNGIKDFASNIWGTIKNTASTIFGEIRDTLSKVWDSVKSTIEEKWTEIKQWFSDTWQAIKDFFKVDEFTQIGKDILNNLWEGMKSIWEALSGWVSGIASDIASFFSGIISDAEEAINASKEAEEAVSESEEKSSKRGGATNVIRVNGYASGGFPRSGQVFVAREDGVPEMVGSWGGKSAVANNAQIVAGISSGVYNAIKSAASGLSLKLNVDTSNIQPVRFAGLPYAYGESYLGSGYSDQYSARQDAVGSDFKSVMRDIIREELLPVMQAANNSRDELLEEIASKDTSIYMDGRRVNQMLDKQRARSGHVLRKQY